MYFICIYIYIYTYIIYLICRHRRGPKGCLAKGRLAKGRRQCGLNHGETYRTPIFCTVPLLPKVPLVPAENTNADTNANTNTPSPPIKSLDFRGFDSSRLLILRCGNSHVC